MTRLAAVLVITLTTLLTACGGGGSECPYNEWKESLPNANPLPAAAGNVEGPVYDSPTPDCSWQPPAR